jgi:hypothetical protein
MTIQETIEELVELWRLRSVFPDKEALLQLALEQCKLTMGSGGEMIGHYPKWTCIIDENGYTCTCPDHQYRGSKCKHLGALATKINNNWSQEFPNQEDNNETN